MDRPFLLHMITTAKNLSPFDVNMAYDAGWDACTPYVGVGLEEVEGLVQDAIFSRGPKGVKRTGIFLGGRDANLAMDMLEAARKAMVPPFEVSVFADPSGAFTTAGAMVACVQSALRARGSDLSDRRTLVFGGTGPVGSAAAVLAARAGADVSIVSHRSRAAAQKVADAWAQRYGVALSAADGSTGSDIESLLADAEVVLNSAAAGVQVLSASQVRSASRLQVACDVNAVPPAGIEGVGVMDKAKPLAESTSDAVGIGALAVGNVKYKAQNRLLTRMRESDSPLYLGFNEAYEAALKHVD